MATTKKRYKDTAIHGAGAGAANFPGGVNFRRYNYEVKYTPGKVKTHKDSRGGRL